MAEGCPSKGADIVPALAELVEAPLEFGADPAALILRIPAATPSDRTEVPRDRRAQGPGEPARN